MTTRRALLRASVCTLGVGVAGCTGRGEQTFAGADGELSVYASLFPLYDFTRQVGGEGVTVENAVASGGHGHEWEPPFDLVPEILEADAFVYLGVEGFQPWAEDAVERIEGEHADEVVLIDALEGIDLRRYDDHDVDHDHSHDHSHEHDHDHSHDEHDHTHEHGEYDAKFFSDPLLAREGVRNVRDGLIDLDPDNAETYERNAETYLESLEDLQETYEHALADRDHDVVVLAGHNSIGYLADRYDFEVHTPVGLSPDQEPSPDALADTVDLVEDRGLEYVLWDYFDGERVAEAVLEEADSATETLMISPAESTVEEWEREGIDSYVAQMREINLPAFETALGATGE